MLRALSQRLAFPATPVRSSGPRVDFRDLLSNRYTLYFAAGCVAFYIYNLDEAPFTKRSRFLWVPLWLETKIGDYLYSQIMHQYQHQLLPGSDRAYLQVSRVMNKLLASAVANTRDPAQAAHLKSLNWTINIIKVTDETREPPNAFILPNGKIFIFLSILPICQNEDGLATVLSHELSHQLAHHSLEQLSKQPFYVMLSTLLYAATGITGFSDLLIAGFLQMPASREMESEADRIGCELMARLCFDVHEAVNFWARMENYENRTSQRRGAMLKEFLSTHPNTHKRVQDISLWMPEFDVIREASECHQWGTFQDVTRNFFKRA
ncbi:hypothetical protein METBIDRAFT_76234 [Metschnikowia bicuspidata var. bicuspidata NRRL YB-4993]|uniref:Peptidase M48 domain-containing protein n=1 Tax=Metschnikowia bicuspidata var. bicuspidata NRRL YB-4993 TaxID=869754 RepID=A0A1A0HGN8_9ASCO|nr:hypothetical protein METBIDRAFT_76234 [Metschnikowia bicuspidata var. bicuspidata NRRL YB-4993]OBA23166.1 hypothetical protein METBIDRAFT_76234 [Metschnikowia bicuspidata var. bicuspidata NRRL YB-4993]